MTTVSTTLDTQIKPTLRSFPFVACMTCLTSNRKNVTIQKFIRSHIDQIRTLVDAKAILLDKKLMNMKKLETFWIVLFGSIYSVFFGEHIGRYSSILMIGFNVTFLVVNLVFLSGLHNKLGVRIGFLLERKILLACLAFYFFSFIYNFAHWRSSSYDDLLELFVSYICLLMQQFFLKELVCSMLKESFLEAAIHRGNLDKEVERIFDAYDLIRPSEFEVKHPYFHQFLIDGILMEYFAAKRIYLKIAQLFVCFSMAALSFCLLKQCLTMTNLNFDSLLQEGTFLWMLFIGANCTMVFTSTVSSTIIQRKQNSKMTHLSSKILEKMEKICLFLCALANFGLFICFNYLRSTLNCLVGPTMMMLVLLLFVLASIDLILLFSKKPDIQLMLGLSHIKIHMENEGILASNEAQTANVERPKDCNCGGELIASINSNEISKYLD